MLFNYAELNENILYLVENLKYIEKKYNVELKSITSDSGQIKSSLSRAIQNCLTARDLSDQTVQNTKSTLFTFLFRGHVGERQLVPSPALSFDLISRLAIENQLENISQIFESFEEAISQSLQTKLVNYLTQLVQPIAAHQNDYSGQNNLLFSINFIFSSSSQTNLAALMAKVFLTLESNQTSFSLVNTDRLLNKIVNQISTLVSTGDNCSQEVQFLLDLVYYLSERFTSMDVCLADSGKHVLGILCAIYTNHKDIQSLNRSNQFYSYIKDLLKVKYNIDFDEYFIITNKLEGCHDLLRRVVLSKSFEDFNERDLECLKCFAFEPCLVNTHEIYNVLGRLNSPLTNTTVRAGLGQLFWTLFESLEASSVKIELVSRIYDEHEICLNADCSVQCLDSEELRNELTVGINQISYGNCEDPNVVNRLVRLSCVYLHVLVNKLLANALNNKTQIPAVTRVIYSVLPKDLFSSSLNNYCYKKLLRIFSRLLTCQSASEANVTVLLSSLRSELSMIVQNRNERIFQNYCKLLQEISREPKLYDSDTFFEHILARDHLNLTDQKSSTFNFSLLYSYEVYEIIYKTGGSKIVHLIYFLQVLNILKFIKGDVNDQRLMTLKEKCLQLVKSLTKRFKNSQVDEDGIQVLRDFSLRSLYWSFSSLIFPLTKCLILPSCLRELLVDDQNNLEVCYFSQEGDSAQIGSFLEVIAINPDFYLKSLKQLENVEYNALLVQTIQVISQTRTGYELNNLFQAIANMFTRSKIEGSYLDTEVVTLLEDRDYANCLNFFVDLTYILCQEQIQLVFYLASLTSFLKDWCLKVQNEQDSFECIIVTLYSLEKLFLFVKSMEVQDVFRFAVELLNHAVQLSNKGKAAVSQKHASLVQICIDNLQLIEDDSHGDRKNYKYLLRQSLENLLNKSQ